MTHFSFSFWTWIWLLWVCLYILTKWDSWNNHDELLKNASSLFEWRFLGGSEFFIVIFFLFAILHDVAADLELTDYLIQRYWGQYWQNWLFEFQAVYHHLLLDWHLGEFLQLLLTRLQHTQGTFGLCWVGHSGYYKLMKKLVEKCTRFSDLFLSVLL